MRRTLACVYLLCMGLVARAEINVVDSLEWMTTDAPLVVRGKVVGFTDTRGSGAVVYRDLDIAVAETLKGKALGKSLSVRLRLLGNDPAGKAWKESGHTFLFFVRHGDEQLDGDAAMKGHWVLRESRQSALDLDRPKKVFLVEMKHAKSAREILERVRKFAARKAPPKVVGAPNTFKAQQGYLRLEIPWDAEIFSDVYAGSTCYLNVPALEKYRALAFAKARSANYHTRAVGADMLRNYPGKETVKLLTTLLNDPGEAKWMRQDGRIVEVTYPVRLAAYNALRALGESPQRPVLKRQPTPEEARKGRTGQKN